MNTRKLAKKVTSYVLIVAMLACSLPIHAFAAETEDALANADAAELPAVAESGPEPEEFIQAFESDVAFVEEPGPDMQESVGFQQNIMLSSFEFSTLGGKILDSGGAGVADVSVMLCNFDENTVLPLYTTGSNGSWVSDEYDVVADYTYIVNYYKAGYEFSQNNIEVAAEAGGTSIADVTATALHMGDLVCTDNVLSGVISLVDVDAIPDINILTA